jgi:hypothetical protein
MHGRAHHLRCHHLTRQLDPSRRGGTVAAGAGAHGAGATYYVDPISSFSPAKSRHTRLAHNICHCLVSYFIRLIFALRFCS